ncbi:hypothetical protein [Lentzea atacamensis]|uniref:hypothetical protein n=1 Tax=Lentzea atacamensis TaxID=531938 RepID=UPI0011BEFE25|nr:hypothetical protein [Lentzea atacamensis]
MADAWTAIISAGAALSGVGLTQLWQSRRERTRWQQERERDELQWKQQRSRDREMWKRDDYYRFAEEKRKTFAEFLALVGSWRDEIETMCSYLAEVLEGQAGGIPGDITVWAMENNHEAVVRSAEQANLLTQRIRLLCTGRVVEVVGFIYGEVHLASVYALSGMLKRVTKLPCLFA